MTCEECERILLDSSSRAGIRGRMPGVSVLNLAKAHAQNCSACVAKMFEIGSLDDALDKLRISTIRTEAPAAIGTNLLAAFRERGKVPDSPIVRVFPWSLVLGSAAALSLVAIVIMLYPALSLRSPATHTIGAEARGRSGGEHPVREQLPTSSSGTTPERLGAESNRLKADHTAVTGSRGADAKLDKPLQARTERRSSVSVRDDLSLNGGGSIVRVTLPLSGLVAMGVSVHSDISDQRVTADVMRDPFGTVVAIRLVETNPTVN